MENQKTKNVVITLAVLLGVFFLTIKLLPTMIAFTANTMGLLLLFAGAAAVVYVLIKVIQKLLK